MSVLQDFDVILPQLISLDQTDKVVRPPPHEWSEIAIKQPFAQPARTLVGTAPARTREQIAYSLALGWAARVEVEAPLSSDWRLAMAPFWWSVAVASLNDWTLWQSPRHPVTLVLEHLLLLGRSIDERPVGATAQLIRDVQHANEDLAEHILHDAKQLMPALKTVNDILRQFREQQRHADQLLLANEESSRRSTTAQSAVTRAIRRAVYGQPVPALIVNFIDTVWRRCLYLLYLRHGMEHPVWQQALKDIELLVWLGGEASAEQVLAAQTNQYKQLKLRLREGVALLHGDQQVDQSFFNDLDLLMLARARNAPDAGLPLGELAYDGEDEDDVPAHNAAREPSGLVLQMRAGDCLRLSLKGRKVRARLIEVDLSHDNYLFADSNGNKLASLNRLTLSGMAQRDELAVIAALSPLDLARALEVHFQAALNIAQSRLRSESEAAIQAHTQQLSTQFDERLKQETSQRKQRISAARKIAENEKLQQVAQQMVQSLRTGALLQIDTGNGPKQCYLAMINTQTGCYVLVDRQGQRQAELPAEHLISLKMANKLEILESGSALDNTLRGLVQERREFLKDLDT